MKKIVALLCTLLCLLSLAACGETADELAKKKQAAEMEQSYVTDVEQYLFMQNVKLINYLSEENNYYVAMNYDNEEMEHLFCIPEKDFFIDGHGLKTAIESFRLARQTVGAMKTTEAGVVLGTVKAEIVGDQIIAHAEVQCEKQTADIELIFSKDYFCKLEGGSLNPRSSFGELMEKAGLNTLIGMGTVFTVLILISLIIALFGLIPKIQAAFSKKETEEPKPAVTQAPAIVEAVAEDDDTELVAVIAAAIAAYEGSTNTDGFVVRSIRRRK